MTQKNTLTIFIASIIGFGMYFYFFQNTTEISNVGSETHSLKENGPDKNVVSKDSLDEPSSVPLGKGLSLEQEELVEKVESLEVANSNELALSFVEIFGQGVPFEMSREAQERLFAKIAYTRDQEIYDQHKEAEYEPAYDATWSTDVQIKAVEEVNNHFSDDAYISKYDCDGSTCSLGVSLGTGEGLPYSDAAKFLTSLRSSPAILKSGAKRNVFLNEIKVNEDGDRVVDYIIGKESEADSSAEN